MLLGGTLIPRAPPPHIDSRMHLAGATSDSSTIGCDLDRDRGHHGGYAVVTTTAARRPVLASTSSRVARRGLLISIAATVDLCGSHWLVAMMTTMNLPSPSLKARSL